MFYKCPKCRKRYFRHNSAIVCMLGDVKRDAEELKRLVTLLNEASEAVSMNINDRAKEEEQRRRRNQSNSRSRTSNSVLDGTVYTGGYSDYPSGSSGYHSSSSHSYDSGSSSCDSSSSSSSCD